MGLRRDSQKDEPELVWDRPEPPRRPAPSPLSRATIVRAAIDLADAGGLEAVSLRKVARALDVGPMRLYGYVSTKEELLDLMVDEVYADFPSPRPDGGDWRAGLRSLAIQTRLAACRHEWFADLIGGRPHFGPHALAALEASLATLNGVPGFDNIDDMMQALGTVQAYVIGAIRAEITERRTTRATGMDKRQWQIASGPSMRRVLTTGRYPMLAKVVQDATHRDAETTFQAGLTYVLDGIAAHLGR